MIMGLLACVALLLGLHVGDPGVLGGPGLGLLASAIGRVYMKDSPESWASLAYASALAYGLMHLDTGIPGLAGLALPLATCVITLALSSRRFNGRAWIHAFTFAGILGAITPLLGVSGDLVAAVFAAGLPLYLLEVLGWAAMAAAAATVAIAEVAGYYGLEGRGWLLLAGAGAAAGFTLLKSYVDLVRGRDEESFKAMIAFIGFSALFLGAAMASTGVCSVEFLVDSVSTSDSVVTLQVTPSRVLGHPLSNGEHAFTGLESRLAELAFRRVAMGAAASLGVVESVEFYDVEANESLILHLGEGYLVFEVDKPVSIWFAVEESGGSYLLRAALKVCGLAIPWSLLEGVDYTPGHTFVRVNYSAPLTVESPAGFRLEAYSVVVYPESLGPGEASVEETPLGLVLKRAVLGVSEGTIVFRDGVVAGIPANVSSKLYNAWARLMEAYSKTPDRALLVSASPVLAYSEAPTNVNLTLPSTATVSGGGVKCTAAVTTRSENLEVLESCRAPLELEGLSACLTSPPPLTSTPVYWEVDLAKAALAHKASSTWPGATTALASAVMGGDSGATAWTGLYLEILDVGNARLKGEFHPYYGLGFIAPFLAAAGFTIAGVFTKTLGGKAHKIER